MDPKLLAANLEEADLAVYDILQKVRGNRWKTN